MGFFKTLLVKAYYKLQKYNSTRRDRKYMRAIPQRLEEIRKKDKIRVVFVVHEQAQWKTESLYLAMKDHPRFDPIICPSLLSTYTPSATIRKFESLIDYLREKGYKYSETNSITKLSPDITFYSQPYENTYMPSMDRKINPGLLMYVAYGINNVKDRLCYDHPVVNLSAMFFVENELVKGELSKLMSNRGGNIIATGIPISDVYNRPLSSFDNPWKPQEKKKLKVIWAPHFSFRDGFSWFNFGSFLNLYEGMLELAVKYQDQIQFAFKPHPRLYLMLMQEWGKEKADAYYDKWRTMPNTQLDEGEYMALFKHSDAMIHDCGSFIVEYLFVNKPVLYTLRSKDTLAQLNQFGLKGCNVLEHGNQMSDVEAFIKNVLEGIDPKKSERERFVSDYLLGTKESSSCHNIIQAILCKYNG